MKEITISKDDFDKACTRAKNRMMKIMSKDMGIEDLALFGMQFVVIQAEIYGELFKEEGENYA